MGRVRPAMSPLCEGPRDGVVAAFADLRDGDRSANRARRCRRRRRFRRGRTCIAHSSRRSKRTETSDAIPLDPTTGLVTREHAEKMLTKLAAADASQSPVTVALVELAPIDWIGQTPMR